MADRSTDAAREFLEDLAERLAHRVQLTTDGHRPHLEAVEGVFGADIDYAVLMKLYGSNLAEDERRYSPATCVGTQLVRVNDTPGPRHVSTSDAERQNLTMRMHMRRFTRLTNGFSRNVENHACAAALYFMHYNFCRIHQSLRVTPAMEAGVAKHVWSLEEVATLVDQKNLVSN